jgi:hypothetical protein
VLYLPRRYFVASPQCLLLQAPARRPPRPYSSSRCLRRSAQRGKLMPEADEEGTSGPRVACAC